MSQLSSPFDKWLNKPLDGKGLHPSLFAAAAFFLEEKRSREKSFAKLREACNEVDDRYVSDREIWEAVDCAYRRITGEISPGPIWPRCDHQFRLEILKLYSADIAKLKLNIPADAPALTYLHSLYKKNDLLCIGKTAHEFRTVRLSEIPEDNRDLWMCEFINPSPMSAHVGLTEADNWSAHAKTNTGPRVYSVIEFDVGRAQEHASILKYLATKLPLVMIVFSGGKSLHGWFKTSHVTESQVETFYKDAVMLGADPKMFSPCQFSRLPMGRHAGTHKTQRVICFNPNKVYYL